MQIVGEQRIAAPRARVWEALNDPEVLRACIPGCQSLDKEGDDRFNAIAEVKIGPIGARFKGTVQITDLDQPNGYTIVGQGNGGIAGNAKGTARVRLSDDTGGTRISYEVDAQVGGRMAQLGGPIIDATAKQLSAKFFSRFGELASGEKVAAPSTAPTAAVTAATAQASTLRETASPVIAGGYPWTWIVALALAILAGFLLGRSGAADWWAIAVIVLAAVAAGAGYDAGRRSGGRP
jgi:carbon monoxide dehydrogenase subunit G